MDTKLFRLVALSALLSVPSFAHAFYVETRGDTTEPVRYLDGNEASAGIDVELRINGSTLPSVDGVADAIRASFATWSNHDCSTLVFTEGAQSSSMEVTHWFHDEGAIYVLVYFSDSNELWYEGPSVGHFRYGYDATGNLIGATIVLNSRDHQWATDGSSDALDVQSVVTAMIGRSLGITSATEGNTTYPSYAPGDTSKRELGADDVAALTYLYSAGGECVPTEPEAICDSDLTDDCPPSVVTNPGDGGTLDPDGGATPRRDAGVSHDAGGPMGTTHSGCSAAPGGSAGAWIVALGMFLAVRRRRR